MCYICIVATQLKFTVMNTHIHVTHRDKYTNLHTLVLSHVHAHWCRCCRSRSDRHSSEVVLNLVKWPQIIAKQTQETEETGRFNSTVSLAYFFFGGESHSHCSGTQNDDGNQTTGKIYLEIVYNLHFYYEHASGDLQNWPLYHIWLYWC